MEAADKPIPADVLDAMRRGQSVEAMKRLRAATGLSWADTVQLLAEHLRDHPQDWPEGDADGPARLAQALALVDQMGGRQGEDTGGRKPSAGADGPTVAAASTPAGSRSPGEVPRSSSTARWIVVLAVVGLVGYAAFMAFTT